MDNELNDKIKEIGSMFGISDIPDNIGEIVSSFLTSSSGKAQEAASEQSCAENNTAENLQSGASEIGHTNQGGYSEDIDMTKILKILKRYKEAKKNKEHDKKIKLLYAVEPFLNEKRRDKVNHCVKFLTFAELAKDLKDI